MAKIKKLRGRRRRARQRFTSRIHFPHAVVTWSPDGQYTVTATSTLNAEDHSGAKCRSLTVTRHRNGLGQLVDGTQLEFGTCFRAEQEHNRDWLYAALNPDND